jgi:hypothetical protein
MAMSSRMFCALAAAAVTVFACSSGGGGAGSSGDGGSGSSSGGSGTVTFSCTVPDLCTEVVGPPSGMAGELMACNTQNGTFGMGCSTSGVVGCCNGIVTQCAYSAAEAMVVQPLCAKNGRTWSAPDGGVANGAEGGVSGAGAFVGTWARSGTQTVTCPTGNPTTTMLKGALVIALGSASGSITATQPDGCVTNYTVTGNVATAAAGQSCNVTTEAGIAETITVTTHTLTLSADGTTLMSMGTETIDKTATMTMCTAMSSGTYTKQ